MNNKKKQHLTLLLISFCFTQLFYAQQPADNLISVFKNYTSNPRELIYTHINKSTFIKGETMGFTAYVIDKESKKTSLTTNNLYCVLEDANKNIIKSKLIKVNEGTGNGIFNIDSLFTSGQYTFKAYTNWQRNFDEPNFYTQIIEVIDDNSLQKNANEELFSKVDAQFLPESGHAVSDVKNTFGVAIKNGLGFGIPNIEGSIIDSNNNTITGFKVNTLGIGSLSFTPSLNETYSAIFYYQDKKHTVKLNSIEDKGIILNLKSTNDKVYVSIKTNMDTQLDIEENIYNLTIHNGNVMKIVEFDLSESLEFTSLINNSDLTPGINIFTVFDENNTPILERLYFKHEGIEKISSPNPVITKNNDTLNLTLTYKSLTPLTNNNLSISVLPSDTKSYNHNHNIISAIHLQPYIKGHAENAKHYFTNVNREKKYDLDNLLITQGWSSYNWHNIFNNPPGVNYVFEKGIFFKASVNSKNAEDFLMYPMRYSDATVFKIDPINKVFQQKNLFPINNETLKIAEINKSGTLKNPTLYIQYYPSSIPNLEYKTNLLSTKYKRNNNSELSNNLISSNLHNVQQLDEVVIEAKKNKTRLEELRRSSYGYVDLWDKNKRKRTPSLLAYLSKWFTTGTNRIGDPFIINKSSNSTSSSNTPLVFIDDIPTQGFNQLLNIPMDIIDYIEINKSGLGEGIRGGGGVIRIYTDPNVNLQSTYGAGKVFKAYDFPLTFSEDKKFYKPTYKSYSSTFFNEYGVIEWLAITTLNAKGELFLKLPIVNTSNINLFIEGITEDGRFISEIKKVSLE
ncbi:hypothetical protein [Olleya sp. HaHaR_3_96]|uniref:hypothetical protein n=1 Tax=Olleya sp. HaHaR_3_96 TaxID=2745560 RepID=UPI001C4FB3DF|nr:hypothetical protein [Olleya sp. HaHaR_3_96]QXP60346.1 hypothetical protein H0I26_01500 [Olleya sp. HaHaR_3_96]